MWLLSILPDFAVHLLLTLGILGIIAGFLLGFIPFVSKYKLPIQIISIMIFAFAVYLEGGLANEQSWQMKVKELEAKVAEAKAKSEKVNTEIVTKIVEKEKVITQKGKDIITIIEKEVPKIENTCTVLPDIVVRIHNAAALNDPTLITVPENKSTTKVEKKPETTNKPALILPSK